MFVQSRFSFPKLPIMFGLFKKKTELELLREQYQKLLEEAYQLSRTNRAAADKKSAEAAELIRRIESMQ